MMIREVIKSYNANITESEDCAGGNDYVIALKEYSHNPQYEVHVFNGPQMIECTICATYDNAKNIFHEKQMQYLKKVVQYAD